MVKYNYTLHAVGSTEFVHTFPNLFCRHSMRKSCSGEDFSHPPLMSRAGRREDNTISSEVCLSRSERVAAHTSWRYDFCFEREDSPVATWKTSA